jgi:hypothetical protein
MAETTQTSKETLKPTVTTKDVPMTIGSALFMIKAVGKTVLGEDKFKEIINHLTPETKQIINNLILSYKWYPENVFAELMQVGFEIAGKEATLKAVRMAAVKEMNSVFRFIMKVFVNPQKFAQNNERLWTKCHNSGKFKVIVNEPKTHSIEITEFNFINDAYKLSWIEYHKAVLEMIGAKNAKCIVFETKEKYIFKFTWE